ncbi:hypothetical protein AWL63_11820 [Sphingomonas panacis]|uniref:Colicin transporter n=1 Tax=Sphingomonas panacis TaxID=1560345 RepID=A0A1B3ZAU0_9SPHN|nr:hypothetical protein [Sphingomonas panacis]AOH84554.1 hypothetical protein AWL63_11820 [Sphingomonas panacis]
MLGLAWKTLGWFLAGVAVALGFLLVPLQVAAERKKLDRTVADIVQARRDIRALETEFETRANLAQLDQWNNDTLRLVAPGAGQFVADEAALAAIDVRQPGTADIQTASFVPAPPVTDSPAAATPAQVETAAVAPVRTPAPVATPAKPTPVAAVAAVKPTTAKRAKAQAVAMLDRKLLSDSTVGDLLSSARAESRRAR